MSVYQHVLAGMQTEAAAMFARLLVPSIGSTDPEGQQLMWPVDRE
jgi:hypothetical protein